MSSVLKASYDMFDAVVSAASMSGLEVEAVWSRYWTQVPKT